MTAMRFDLPQPDLETQPFWDGTRESKLLIKHCSACDEYHFYPRPFCPKCWSVIQMDLALSQKDQAREAREAERRRQQAPLQPLRLAGERQEAKR